MPQLIITADIHGHLPTWRKITAHLEPGDGLAIAGDLFDTVYAKPGGVVQPETIRQELDQLDHSIWIVQGNCDHSDFYNAPLQLSFSWEGTTCLLAHGHKYLPDLTDYDIVIQGHSHVSRLEALMGKIFLNPGSPILPRGGHKGFARLKNGVLELVTLSGMVMDRLEIGT